MASKVVGDMWGKNENKAKYFILELAEENLPGYRNY